MHLQWASKIKPTGGIAINTIIYELSIPLIACKIMRQKRFNFFLHFSVHTNKCIMYDATVCTCMWKIGILILKSCMNGDLVQVSLVILINQLRIEHETCI